MTDIIQLATMNAGFSGVREALGALQAIDPSNSLEISQRGQQALSSKKPNSKQGKATKAHEGLSPERIQKLNQLPSGWKFE